jgi:tRNA-dihydrouridine synthase B
MFYQEKFVGVCVIKSYQIRHIQVNPGLVLSPMSGVTTRPFRRLIKELNPGAVGLVVSEFVSVEGMTRGSQRTLEMMRFSEEERPYCVQIFGYDVDRMRDAALMVQDIGADLVDINCGCPAPKVVKRGGGCELMRQPDHLQSIIREVKRAISIPLTLKIRAGWDESSRNAFEIAKMAEGEGIEALAIHGRTRSQLYRGEADWDLVQEIAEVLSIPVLGSGDVVCRTTAEARLKGKVAGLFIGRASMMNPYVFTDIVKDQPSQLKGNHQLMLDVLFRYIELLREDFQDNACGGKFKQLASQMCRGAPWRKQLLQLNAIKDHEALLLAVRDGRWRPAAVHVEESDPTDVSCDMYSA